MRWFTTRQQLSWRSTGLRKLPKISWTAVLHRPLPLQHASHTLHPNTLFASQRHHSPTVSDSELRASVPRLLSFWAWLRSDEAVFINRTHLHTLSFPGSVLIGVSINHVLIPLQPSLAGSVFTVSVSLWSFSSWSTSKKNKDFSLTNIWKSDLSSFALIVWLTCHPKLETKKKKHLDWGDKPSCTFRRLTDLLILAF